MIPSDNADYEERAPYIIAAFCNEAQERDKAWRALSNITTQENTWNPVFIALQEVFPLSDRFASAAVFYLAAMLVLDIDEELSDKFYDRFCDAMSTIDSNIELLAADTNDDIDDDTEETSPYILESIKNVYF